MKRILDIQQLLFLCLLMGMVMFSCKDDELGNGNPDKAPQVILTSPTNGSTFNSGADIPLRLSIKQDADITSYRVLIRDRASAELVFVLSEFTQTPEIVIDTLISLTAPESSIMDIEVRAEDSFGNQFEGVIGNFTLDPPLGNKLTLKFDLKYNGDVLLMNEEYIYPTGEVFELSKFDLLITDLTLLNGNEETIINDVAFLEMTQTYRNSESANLGYLFTIAGLEDGSYDAVRFNIGLPPALNSTTPSDYPVSHPLGKADYWDNWDSYIFTTIDGKINIDTSNPDLEKGIALHLGTDDALQVIDMPLAFELSNNEVEIVDINIDFKDIFANQNGEIYDIVTNPQTHGEAQLEMVIELSNNLKNSIIK